MSEYKNNSNHELDEMNLFNEFPKPTVNEWRDVVEKSLKGATIEEKLVTKTYEEISLQPMYRSEDLKNFRYLDSKSGEFPYLRGTNQLGYIEEPWAICQELSISSPEEFNQVALNDLQKGQTMLHILIESNYLSLYSESTIEDNHMRKGLLLSSIKDFEIAFKGIDLEEVPLFIEIVHGGLGFFATFISYLNQQNYDLKKIKSFVGMDPLGDLVKFGTIPYSMEEALEIMADITKWSVSNAPNVETINIQGNPYHDAGGNAIHELAFTISSGVEYLRGLEKHQVSIDDIAQRIRFSFSIGSNFFMEIAKLRAARMIWARIVKELGGNEASQKMFIHSRTSAWSKTIYDPYVNILRGTVEAFAGVIGGVDSLHVSPFDEPLGAPDEFSRRIARNTHMILDKEANLSKVVDPAGGSWYVESLTYTLAEKVWELFQKIEELGGMYNAIQAGFPQELIGITAEKRAENIKLKKDVFVGTNIFPNLQEKKLIKRENSNCSKPNVQNSSNHKSYELEQSLKNFSEIQSFENALIAINNGASIDDLDKSMYLLKTGKPTVRPLRIHRGAEPFEYLREKSEEYKNRTGNSLTVFAANIGPISSYKQRVDFVTDFFEVGGFQVIQNSGFSTIEEIVETYKLSKSKIVVICSTDDHYAEYIPALVREIQKIDLNTTILITGNPTVEEMNLYKNLGVNDFIHSKINNYEKLVELLLKGGI
ncbi:methylmalonyl-CoA mutase family protein [Bacillus sp. EAC]|uniref:methylmalonyl-CoA mutase family protein n=1 Tax=Bacillus sp. EAC TaxID=1978338 RepID=UPI000B441CD3|nr:methylmalonyl-CoA mutase family protein [Bacillus sp. EAC]